MRRTSRIAAILVLTMSSATFLAAVAPGADAHQLRREAILKLVNQKRGALGLHRLDMPKWLVHYARRHSRLMAARGTIFHTNNLGAVLRTKSWREAGENVGAGGDWPSIFNAFMKSSEHRWNILHSAYHHVGIGSVYSHGTLYLTMFFYG